MVPSQQDKIGPPLDDDDEIINGAGLPWRKEQRWGCNIDFRRWGRWDGRYIDEENKDVELLYDEDQQVKVEDKAREGIDKIKGTMSGKCEAAILVPGHY